MSGLNDTLRNQYVTKHDVINALCFDCLNGDLDENRCYNYPCAEIEAIMRMPVTQPQRMKGRWIHDGYDIPHGVDWMHCSVCGRREPHVPAAMTNFCPTCGSDMRGEQDG